jgi:transposase InsO family protein
MTSLTVINNLDIFKDFLLCFCAGCQVTMMHQLCLEAMAATREGWLYLATVIDLYSRRVVGWSMADNMRTSLVNDALSMALNQRKPANDLLWHSDRGSQYASESHRALLTANGITQSMSRKGNCWDNAVAESFFHSLKTELVHHCDFATRAEAKQEIFEYIEVFYNRKRRHSANDYKSPADYEMSLKAA